MLAGVQIFRNSTLTRSSPTPTSKKDRAVQPIVQPFAHIVCSALWYFQIKAAQVLFETTLTVCVLHTYNSTGVSTQRCPESIPPRFETSGQRGPKCRPPQVPPLRETASKRTVFRVYKVSMQHAACSSTRNSTWP